MGNFDDILRDFYGVHKDIRSEIDKLTDEINRDPLLTKDPFSNSQAPKTADTIANPASTVTTEKATFEGVEEALNETIYGQEAFLKALTIAFKRPFVLKEENGHARNVIYLNGPEDTGKHMALTKITEILAKKRLLSSSQVYTMDLSRYTSADSGTVFLQDLFVALSSDAKVILFENFSACHISCLQYINELVLTGACRLNGRYAQQNGQLISVSNAFAANVVDSFRAEGRFLVFIGTGSVQDLANVFGAPFVNALGDICTSVKLEKDSFLKISDNYFKQISETAKKQLGFTLSGDTEGLSSLGASRAERNGVAGIKKFYGAVLKSLADIRLNGNDFDEKELTLAVNDGVITALSGEETHIVQSDIAPGYTGDIDAVKKELDNIVGLDEVKKYVLSLEEYYSIQKKRREQGLKASEVNKHMIFTGSPGTGKTTIARIISRYLKAIGVLTGGQLVEVTRADLVGRYVGHTAPLTTQVLNSAIGGVLFIDEAYSLYRGKDDSFGLEAIDTLVKGIEDNRDNLIVILAGYSKEMAEFLTSNSGLKSRFPNIIDFPDYTKEELLGITKITVKSKGYTLDEDVEKHLLQYYGIIQATKAATAGNGRLVRNKVEEAILNQSRRLVAEPDADLCLLTAQDFVFDDIDRIG